MSNNVRFFAVIVFVAIALFLVSYTWLPSRDSLQSDQGQISGILPQANMWYEVEITLSGGERLTCRGKHGWPLVGPSRCPLEKFEALQGQTITILHDTKRPYEVMHNGNSVMDYSVFQKAHRIGVVLALLMLVMAFFVWKYK